MLHPFLRVPCLARNSGLDVPDFFPTGRSKEGSLNFGLGIALVKIFGVNTPYGEDVPDLDVTVLCMAENKSQNVYTDIAAEVKDNNTDTTYVVRYRPLNGSIEAVSGGNNIYSAPVTANDKIKLPAMTALLIPVVAHAIYSPNGRPMPFLKSALEDYENANTDVQKKSALLNISKLLENNIVSTVETGMIKLQESTNINTLDINELKDVTGRVIVAQGNPEVLKVVGGKTSNANKKDNTFGVIKEEFEEYVKTLNWTPEEEKLIPHFEDDFPVPEETLKFARRFLHSREAARPMVQFMWRGPTSYGKSTGVECMAALLHTPLLKTTCHPNMETSDFLADFVPDTSANVAEDELPTFDDMSFDPVGAYYQMTGEYKEEVTSQDCLLVYAKKANVAGSNTPRFKFVESNYVKALSRGYICEVQEASRIRNAGVLVGLNEFDRPGSVIPLLNGSYATRHQNAIVIFTDNIGYASCRPLDPSVLRRMAFIVDSGELDKQQLFERVRYNTGCRDNGLLEKAYLLYDQVMKYAQKNDMMDEGSISATEFEMMIQCAMMEPSSDLKDIAKDCLISKASSDPEMQKMLENIIGCA